MSERTFQDVKMEGGKKCPECGGELEYQKGELVCKKCGLVIE